MKRNISAIAAKTLITDDTIIQRPLILLDGENIARITTQDAEASPEQTMSLPEATLSFGFMDVHVHGAGGRDVMEGTAESFATVSRILAGTGTTRFLATTVTASIDKTLRSLDGIADAIDSVPSTGGAAAIGIHLEGPFLSHGKRGVHPAADLQPPSIDLFERFYEAARGHVRLITIAPEVAGALDLISHAVRRGVRVSLGHSDALATEARAGVAAGATSATHTFNAMRLLTQREAGMLGVVLDANELYAELICDGVHTTPEAVRLWLRMKGTSRAMLVTDGLAAMGMPDGRYMLGEMEVEVVGGVCKSSGVLAGSVLTMDRAVANVQAFTGLDLPNAVRLASRNPAAMLQEAPSKSADFNIFNQAGQRTGTILRAQLLSA